MSPAKITGILLLGLAVIWFVASAIRGAPAFATSIFVASFGVWLTFPEAARRIGERFGKPATRGNLQSYIPSIVMLAIAITLWALSYWFVGDNGGALFVIGWVFATAGVFWMVWVRHRKD